MDFFIFGKPARGQAVDLVPHAKQAAFHSSGVGTGPQVEANAPPCHCRFWRFGGVPDSLVQCTLGAGGVEALLLAAIKVSKVLSGQESGREETE